MPAMMAITAHCPVCDDPIRIPIDLSTRSGDEHRVIVSLKPDLSRIKQHAWEAHQLVVEQTFGRDGDEP